MCSTIRFCTAILTGNLFDSRIKLRSPIIQCLKNYSSQFDLSGRAVPATPRAQREVVQRPPEQLPDARFLQVAVLGEPNAGKSTLINDLVGWRVCSVSKKVHTTRRNVRGVLVEGDTQIVFLDTPGLVTPNETKRFNLEPAFLADPERALMEANLLVVLHDISHPRAGESLSQKILRLLYLYPEKEAVLVMNKVDLVKEKRKLLDYTRVLSDGVVGGRALRTVQARSVTERPKKLTLEMLEAKQANRKVIRDSVKQLEAIRRRKLSEKEVFEVIRDKIGWPGFSQVFMVSALNSDGVPELREFLLSTAKPSSWLYHSSVVTDQNPYDMAKSALKEKLLEYLPNEVPYTIDVNVEYWDVNASGALTVQMKVDCHKGHVAKLVIGGEGQKIKRIARETEQELRNTFRCDVRLKLDVVPHFPQPR